MTELPKEIKKMLSEEGDSFELILFNDDFHQFDFVIDKLKQHCGHSPEQAEQCAFIAHHKGESSILMGGENRIEKIKNKLALEGLIVDSRKVTV